MATGFKPSYWSRLHDAGVPSIDDRRQFPRMRREWAGKRVAIHYVAHRGNERRRTQMGWAFGILTTNPDKPECISVKDPKTGTVTDVYYRRVTDVFDLTNAGRI